MSHETDDIKLPSSRLSSASKKKQIDSNESSGEIHILTNENHSVHSEEQTTNNNDNHSHSHHQSSMDFTSDRKPPTPPLVDQKPNDSKSDFPKCDFRTG
jgi:hypothetical protein